MRIKCLTCEVLARPTYLSAAYSPHIVDVQLLQRSLHNTPAMLRDALQAEIDAADAEKYDAVVLAYGLCGKGTHGLEAKHVPLVVPRAHDCITLFLGGRDRYKEQFTEHKGTYWYVLDYMERGDGSSVSNSPLGANTNVDLDEVRQEYVEKYGEDNADYLMEVMGAWQEHYQRAAFIDMGVGDGSAVENLAKTDAERRGWTFDRVEGNLLLIRRLVEGDWDTDFLTLEPGQSLEMTYDDEVIGCVMAAG